MAGIVGRQSINDQHPVFRENDRFRCDQALHAETVRIEFERPITEIPDVGSRLLLSAFLKELASHRLLSMGPVEIHRKQKQPQEEVDPRHTPKQSRSAWAGPGGQATRQEGRDDD